MKYKIIKKTSKHLSTFKCNGTSNIQLVYNIWYIAKRKGRIFGFWHSIGNETDYYGNCKEYSAQSLEEIEEYIQKYHEWKYGNEVKYEIVKEITI